MNWTYVLIAHGTISELKELPAFLLEIRRGRPPSAELIAEMTHRYEAIGGSPLLAHTRDQADALARRSGVPTRVAMRLWEPRFQDVVADLGQGDGVCLIPLAPFSMEVYEAAARAEIQDRADAPQIVCAAAWGDDPDLIAAYQDIITKTVADCATSVPIVLTAHSLPTRVIRAGDNYQAEFEKTASLVAAGLPGHPVVKCYQSQGADGGDWLGPTLEETLKGLVAGGAKEVVVAPIGFFSEHVETLYDLDIEAQQLCSSIGLHLHRAPTLGTHPGLITALARAAAKATGV